MVGTSIPIGIGRGATRGIGVGVTAGPRGIHITAGTTIGDLLRITITTTDRGGDIILLNIIVITPSMVVRT